MSKIQWPINWLSLQACIIIILAKIENYLRLSESWIRLSYNSLQYVVASKLGLCFERYGISRTIFGPFWLHYTSIGNSVKLLWPIYLFLEWFTFWPTFNESKLIVKITHNITLYVIALRMSHSYCWFLLITKQTWW